MTDLPDSSPASLKDAATVILLREGADGPEVLLLERPRHRGSFAGAWVFPGGGVDADDHLPADAAAPAADQPAAAQRAADQRAARRAAAREVQEETGLQVASDGLALTAVWVPPLGAPKRLRTWFYLTEAPAGPIVLAEDEVVDFAWLRPEVALQRHASALLTLVAPTWVTLHGLATFGSVAEIIAYARNAEPVHYETRLGADQRGPVLFWAGDVAFDDETLVEQPGRRNRLEIGTVPWVYRTNE